MKRQSRYRVGLRSERVPAAYGDAGAVAVVLPGLLIFAAGLLATVLWRLSPAGGWWLPLLCGGAGLAFLTWRRIDWADGWSRYLSFGAVVLLACAINRLFYITGFALDESGYEFPFFAVHPEAAMIKAEVASVVGTLLTVVGWWKAGGAAFSPGLLLSGPKPHLVRLLAVTYASSLLAILALTVAPEIQARLGQLLPTMLALGATTGFFLPVLLARTRQLRVLLVAVMALPFLYVALGTGMKENIILALVPTAYLLWHYSPRSGARLAMALVALLAVGLITSYIGFFRSQVWYAGDSVVDQGQVLDDYTTAVAERGFVDTVSTGMREFVARNNAMPYRGWAMVIADTEGYHPKLVFSPMLYVLVPRALWPGKPEIRQGWEYSGLVFGERYTAWSDSSLSAGLYPALYLGGGWIAVVLGALAIGILMALSTKIAFVLGGSPLGGLFTLSMLPYALRLDETWTVGAFSAPLINLIYVAVILAGARVVARITDLDPVRHG
jgi:hypothetical protein